MLPSSAQQRKPLRTLSPLFRCEKWLCVKLMPPIFHFLVLIVLAKVASLFQDLC